MGADRGVGVGVGVRQQGQGCGVSRERGCPAGRVAAVGLRPHRLTCAPVLSVCLSADHTSPIHSLPLAPCLSSSGNKAVELVNVSLTTPDGSRQLLRDFSFEFSPGARIGIAGPNGAGKSSLLDVVAGLRQPQVFDGLGWACALGGGAVLCMCVGGGGKEAGRQVWTVCGGLRGWAQNQQGGRCVNSSQQQTD